MRMVKILHKAEMGGLILGFRHETVAGLRNTLNNITNRLTFGIIIAAIYGLFNDHYCRYWSPFVRISCAGCHWISYIRVNRSLAHFQHDTPAQILM